MHLTSLAPHCSHGDVSLMALRSDSLEECGQLDAALYWPVKCHWEPLPEAGGGEDLFRTVEIIPFLRSVLDPHFLSCCQERRELRTWP